MSIYQDDQKIRVLVCDDDMDRLEEAMRLFFLEPRFKVVATVQTGEAAIERVKELRPHFAFIDQTLPDMEGIQASDRIRHEVPETFVILTVDFHDPDIYRKAMSFGCSDIITKPFTTQDVVRRVEQILENDRRQKEQWRQQQALSAESGVVGYAAPDGSAALAAKIGGSPVNGGVGVLKQQIITVYSPKGGAGKTTLSREIAVALATNPTVKLRVALVDFDINFGNIAATLNIQGYSTILDWIPYISRLDKETVDKLMVTHPSGLHVLPAPIKPVQESQVTEHVARAVLEALKRVYDVIVIDTTPVLRDSTIVALEMATKVIIVSTLDVAALRDVYNVAEAMQNLDIDAGKCRFVINRYTKTTDLDLNDVVNVIPFPLLAKIPEEPMLQKQANIGEPMVMGKPTPFAEAVKQLANSFCPVFAVPRKRPPAQKQSFFGRLFGRR